MKSPSTMLTEARQKLGWSRKEAARRICPLSTYERYEIGHCLPSVDRATVLCDVLGMQHTEFAEAIEFQKEILRQIRLGVKQKKYGHCRTLYKQLALVEMVPVARNRYLELADLCTQIENEYQLDAVLKLGRK